MFTDRRERFLVQGGLMAMVATTVVAGLLLVWFLSHPYQDQAGSIKPSEMERSIATMATEVPGTSPTCDDAGRPA